MKKGIFMWMAILIFLLLLPPMLLAQDPGIPDTVRFNIGPLPPYPEHCVPVRFFADEPVSGPQDSLVAMVLPFRWYAIGNCPNINLDSVSWIHSEPPIRNGAYLVQIDNQNKSVGISTSFNGLGPTADGIICELCFNYGAKDLPCIMVIDTTFWPPSSRLAFGLQDARTYTPQFLRGEYQFEPDPGIPDTVRFDGGELPVWAGHAPIPAHYFADEWLA